MIAEEVYEWDDPLLDSISWLGMYVDSYIVELSQLTC